MPSPFPGMDPYIESRGLWEDFHQKLVGEIESAAADLVPENYLVRLGERAYVVLASSDDLEPRRHPMQADVAISDTAEPTANPVEAAASSPPVAVTEEEAAVTMHALVEVDYREVFVEILALHPDRRLVTTIEVLSPSNKRRETHGWRQYLRKRQAHMEGHANLVEIDLLRGGQRMPMEEDWPESPYYLLTCWKQNAPACKVWPAYVHQPLPQLRVPLAPPDEDLLLDLQPMVTAIYRRSRYEVDLDYHSPCQPPLDVATQAWLQSRLTELNV